MKYTDHNKNQINLLQYLPEVYKSDINTILSDMVFDRYFTKDDTSRVSGYIGTRNQNAIANRQIVEETPHRQAFQLAPTMYTKVGTVESALSFTRFQQQLELMGVDMNRMPKWANSISFNWVPPVNLDMLINYQDYFWVNASSNDTPQYFTIENRCSKSSFKVSAYDNIIKNRGEKFNMFSFDLDTNSFYVEGNQVSKFPVESEFYTNVSTALAFNNQTWVVSSVSYDTQTELTQITPRNPLVYTSNIAPTTPVNNEWWIDSNTGTLNSWNGNAWVEFTDLTSVTTQIAIQANFQITGIDFTTNSFIIEGDVSDIFLNGFVFFTKNSNILLSNFWTAVSAEYDSNTNTTKSVIQEDIAIYSTTPPTTTIIGQLWYNTSTQVLSTWTGTIWQHIANMVYADISLTEMLAAYQSSSNSVCDNKIGWDLGLWDDNNIGSILWNTDLMTQITHNTLTEWLSNPLNIQTHLALWYNPTTDFLYQYGDVNHANPSDPGYAPTWTAIIGNFSTVLDRTTGNEVWDEIKNKTALQTDLWSTSNHWIHKSSVTSFAGIRRAQIPILEYNSSTELNEWTEAIIPWKYRSDADLAFTESSIIPSRLELEPIKNYVATPINGYWYIYLFNANADIVTNINLTDTFVPDYRFAIVDSVNHHEVYTVDYSEYRLMTTSDPVEVQGNYMVTVVKIKELVFGSPQIGDGANQYRIIPTITSHHEVWRGYHIHWCANLDEITYAPTTNQKLNTISALDNTVQPTYIPIIGNAQYSSFEPQIGILSVGSTYQEFTIDISTPVTTVTLHNNFLYDPNHSNTYAIHGGNELRVYVNKVRQYGNYIETTAVGYPTYTTVDDKNGNQINSTIVPITYVTGIVFNQGVVKTDDIVRIEIGPASFYDMGLHSVPVRTIENDTQFFSAVTAGTQPVYSSITRFYKTEQHKQYNNQYPLFNVYDIISNTVVKASPIFTFLEDPTSPIDSNTGHRIVITNNGTEYSFVQYLIDEDNGRMYAYRNINTLSEATFWYNPTTNIVLYWDGSTWSPYVDVNTTTLAIRPIIVSTTDPVQLWEIDKSIWYNPTTNIVYQRQLNTNSWTEFSRAIVNKTDITLQTIWRHGLNNEEYVPSYVDKDRNVVTVGSPLGDWEVVDQWMYNSEHFNKKIVSFSQVFKHFNSILEAQPGVPGLVSNGVYAYTQDEYHYDIGGTIKEFNYGFDTLVSAVNVNNVTPIGIIEFAEEQYNTSLYNIRALFNSLIHTTFIDTTVDNILYFDTNVINDVILSYEANDMAAKIYGDTTAYDSTNDLGVRNWVATAPMFGLAQVYVPTLSVDGNTSYLIHHDGHRTTITYTLAEVDNFSRKLVALIDPNSNSPIGRTSTQQPPADVTTFMNTFTGYAPGVFPTGVYWYTSNTNQLYRFEMYQASATAPSIYRAGVELPNGTKYYNTTDSAVYEKDDNGWVLITNIGDQDISPMWRNINIPYMLGQSYLEVENRLYDIAKDVPMVFDYSTLVQDDADQLTYNGIRYELFNDFVSESGIVAPFTNTQYSSTDPWTWNYITSNIVTAPSNKTVTPYSYWQAIYDAWYNTPYPHLEPWKLQGYVNKPTWWDSVYAQTNGSRRWLPIMWTNVLNGIVPLGYAYPSGILSTGNPVNDNQVLPTYQYVSVNIGNTTVNGYAPDTILPPYFQTSDPTIRSIFNVYSQIVAPDADYAFYDRGPVEWSWLVSVEKAYDQMIIAFTMQPVKFLHYAFGTSYTNVDELQVDDLTGKVYCHKDVIFHGDVYNTNLIYKSNGLNQWYVNYNRYTGYDVNAEFRTMWQYWTPKMTYQIGGIADTSSLTVDNLNFDVIDSDYNPVLVNNGIVKDLWLDLFNITLIHVPPSIIQYNNQSLWTFEIDTLANVPRTVQYYGVKSFPFVVNTTTNICDAFKYSIIEVSVDAKRIYVDGDQTYIFTANKGIVITDSLGVISNNTVILSVYETGLNRTRVNLFDPVTTNMLNGTVNYDQFTLPWSTGDMVILSTSKMLPYPLVPDTPYYIIRDNTMESNQFKLAETYNESLTYTAIDFTTVGTGELLVSEIVSSFNVLGGESKSKEVWYHFALDKQVVRTITFPATVKGMQNTLNIIDGIAERYVEEGFVIDSADSSDFDPVFGRLIDWQLETERFIDWAYGIRSLNIKLSDRYEISINVSTNIIEFTDMIPSWTNGAKVMISATGSVPTPIFAYQLYYLHQTATVGQYVLSLSANGSDTSMYVDFLDVGTGTIYISAYDRQSNFPKFEMNPVRNNIWLNTPQGVVSNVLEGPHSDVRVQNTLFDQYGRPLTNNNINVYRQDLRTHISIRPNIPNDVDRFYTNDPYNYIHLGGGHIFIEGYEHFILFNDYTVGGNLIYDPFFGLIVNRLNLDYNEKTGYVLRPTLGGYYLNGNQFYRNIEGQATDMNNMYDAFLTKNSEIDTRARDLLGYTANMPYMDLLNVNSKSQFMFYRGMITEKGSLNCFTAYINSKRFLNADIDEYWAYQVAEFGDIRPKVYPEIKILADDNIIDDVRLEFVGKGESVYNTSVQEAQQEGFKVVSYYDETRWKDYPEQIKMLEDSLFLDAEISSYSSILINSFPPPIDLASRYNYWYNTVDSTLRTWNKDTNSWSNIILGKVKVIGGFTYWIHDTICDDVRVIRDNIKPKSTKFGIVGATAQSFTIAGDYVNSIYVNMTIKVINSTTANGTYHVTGSSYDYITATTTITISETITPSVTGQIVADVINFSEYSSDILTSRESGYSSYFKLNAEIVRFSNNAFVKVLHIYTINPSKHKINPAKLVDIKSNVIVQEIPLWHPALGYHYHIADHNIDLRNDTDPALYGHTMNSNDISNRAWNNTEVGLVWLNTAYLGYLPYYDVSIYPDINDRLINWGKLAEFGQARVFVWTRSSSAPADWATIVAQQANNTNIPQNLKLTGTAKTEMFINNREILTGILDLTTSEITLDSSKTITADELYVFSTDYTIPQDIEVSTTYGVFATTNNNTTFQVSNYRDNTLVQFTQLSEVVNVIEVSIGTSTDGKFTDIIECQVQAPLEFVVNGDIVKFETTGKLPEGIVANTEYTVTNVTVDEAGTHQLFKLTGITLAPANPVTPFDPNNPVYYREVGKGTLTATITKKPVGIAPNFKPSNWTKRPFIRKHIPAIMLETYPVTTTVRFRDSKAEWVDNEVADIYVNGHLVCESGTVDVTSGIVTVTSTTALTINEKDVVDVVRAYTNVDLDFNPEQFDDGTNTIWWKQDYEYTTVTSEDAFGNTNIFYYFWVEQSTNVPTIKTTPMSVASVATTLVDNPDPYFIVQKPLDVMSSAAAEYGYDIPPYGTIYSGGKSTIITYDQFPIAYREAIIRKVASYVSTNDRYMIRFNRDLTLRDDIQANRLNNNLKNVHEEWALFRKLQQFNLPIELWNKMVEAISGQSLTTDNLGNHYAVPTLDRVLYDQLYQTETRFGMGVDQAFVDKTLGLATILHYLTDPLNDFSPIDIEDFFKHHSFDTPDNIQTALLDIYNTFGFEHVNTIWFNVLQDALTTKSKYKGLMKTSWVSVHGVQLANVNGIFDE